MLSAHDRFLHGRRVINRSRFDENGPVQLVGVEARAVGNSPLSHGPPLSESKRELSATRRLLTGLPCRSRSASCRQLAAFSRASPVGVEARAVGNSPLSHGPSPSKSKRELSATRRFLTGLPCRSRRASCRQLAAFSRASPARPFTVFSQPRFFRKICIFTGYTQNTVEYS